MTPLGLRYRRADHALVPAWRRWWPLARQEFLVPFRSKVGIAVFCLCLVPAVVRLFVLMIRYGMVDFGAAARGDVIGRSQALAQWDSGRPEFYVELVMGTWPGLPVLILLTGSATAGAIARDRRTNALELLWTRGITPFGYLLARFCGSLGSLCLVTVVAPLALWVAAALMADDWQQLTATLPFLGSVLFALLLVSAVWTALCLCLSAMASSPSQAIVLWCLLLVGSTALANIAAGVLREPNLRAWLSVWDAGGTLARHVAGVSTRVALGPALGFLSGLLLLLGLGAWRRLRVGEAVA